MKNRLIIITVLIFTISCQNQLSEKEFLNKASDKLSAIKSVSYYTTGTASAPGDTTKFLNQEPSILKFL